MCKKYFIGVKLWFFFKFLVFVLRDMEINRIKIKKCKLCRMLYNVIKCFKYCKKVFKDFCKCLWLVYKYSLFKICC